MALNRFLITLIQPFEKTLAFMRHEAITTLRKRLADMPYGLLTLELELRRKQ
jgi:hypothetical protein